MKLPSMSLLFGVQGSVEASQDPRALRILAKTIYRELRQNGASEENVIAIASELVSLIAAEMRDRRENGSGPESGPRL